MCVVSMWMHMRAHTCGSLMLKLESSSTALPPYLLKQGLKFKPSIHQYGYFCNPPFRKRSLNYKQTSIPTPAFTWVSRNRNSSPQACSLKCLNYQWAISLAPNINNFKNNYCQKIINWPWVNSCQPYRQ